MKKIKGRAKTNLKSVEGSIISKNEECFIVEVWINESSSDIYCEVMNSRGEIIITSLNNIEYGEEYVVL